MRNEFHKGTCMAVMGSMTQAMRAQSVLERAAIRCEVVKADTTQSRRGCAYALSYDCMQSGNVKAVLKNAGIRVRSFTGG